MLSDFGGFHQGFKTVESMSPAFALFRRCWGGKNLITLNQESNNHMHFEKKILIFFLILFSVKVADAQSIFPRLGEQRVGTAAMTFLKIGIGARAASMGGAFVPMANDASSLYWNPAGLVQIGSSEGLASHIQWPVGIQYEFVGLVYQLRPTLALGTSAGFLYSGDMEVTDEYHPTGTGQYFSYSDFVGSLSLSIRMTDRFSFGVTGKFAQENLADLEMHTFLFDLGTFYWTGYKSLRFAASMRNFGANVRPAGTFLKRTTSGTQVRQKYTGFSPPTEFSLGAAMEVYQTPTHRVTTSLQMNHPMDNAENAVFGSEYTFRRLFSLRGGYRFNYGNAHWTFGAGAVIPLRKVKLAIDYAYADFGRLNLAQQFSLSFKF